MLPIPREKSWILHEGCVLRYMNSNGAGNDLQCLMGHSFEKAFEY